VPSPSVSLLCENLRVLSVSVVESVEQLNTTEHKEHEGYTETQLFVLEKPDMRRLRVKDSVSALC